MLLSASAPVEVLIENILFHCRRDQISYRFTPANMRAYDGRRYVKLCNPIDINPAPGRVNETVVSFMANKFIANIPREEVFVLKTQRAGALHDHKIAGRKKNRIILPGMYLAESIPAQHEEYVLLTAGQPMKMAYRVDGIGLARPL